MHSIFRRVILYFLRWHWADWAQEWQLSFSPFGRCRASVYPNGVWYTWDEDGIGGENSKEDKVWKAKSSAFTSLVRQGWLSKIMA
jgi:hypothetical protein